MGAIFTRRRTHIVWSSCSSARQEPRELKVAADLYVHDYLNFVAAADPRAPDLPSLWVMWLSLFILPCWQEKPEQKLMAPALSEFISHFKSVEFEWYVAKFVRLNITAPYNTSNVFFYEYWDNQSRQHTRPALRSTDQLSLVLLRWVSKPPRAWRGTNGRSQASWWIFSSWVYLLIALR